MSDTTDHLPTERPATDLAARVLELEVEIERLRQDLLDVEFIEALREAISVAALTGTIGAPVVHAQLLEMIVRTACLVLGVRAASLLLLDEGTYELVFEVAVGEGADAIKQFRVPVGYGIAGRVAQTGRPIWTNDARSDPRHAADIARGSGLMPSNLLCVPLFVNGHLIGVMEVVDRQSSGGFEEKDVEVLEAFSRQAAVAIEQSRFQQNLATMVGEIVTWLATYLKEDDRPALQAAAGPFTSGLEGDLLFRRALDLARLVREIASRGADEAADCQRWLRDYARATRAHATPQVVGEHA